MGWTVARRWECRGSNKSHAALSCKHHITVTLCSVTGWWRLFIFFISSYSRWSSNTSGPRWLKEGREEETEGDKFLEEDKGKTRKSEKGRGERGGGGVRRRQARFLIKTDHSQQP